jgi:hypothetical protein
MNKVGFGIVVLALLAISPEVAFGQKEKQSPQKEKQIPQQFMGMWCDTGNEGANFSISFRRINKSEDCKTKQVLELTTGFLNLYNDDTRYGSSHGSSWFAKKDLRLRERNTPRRDQAIGNECELARVSLQSLPAGERGWITLAEAARLFSTEEAQYAFGDYDEAGKSRLAQFASQYRCAPNFMPTEGRLYFVRNA